jgi:hypothetical protein
MTIQINPGVTDFQPSSRLIQELQLLEKATKNIIVGTKTVAEVEYTLILVKGMPLASSKFTVCDFWHNLA